jgi:hypothetical protein
MKKNMGSTDVAIRLVLAALFVVLYFTTSLDGTTLGIILLIVAGIFALTSLMNFCPLYTVFGISTCKKK